jgi:DNA-binding GntR family transcriptional regulator
MTLGERRTVLGPIARERPEGLQDFVSQRIREAILTGAVEAGQRLYPSRIARDLGVSHIPVREALSTLDATGHVRHVPRLGYFVADLSYEVIADTYRMRDLLESEAHRLVIGRLPAARLRRMRELNEQMVVAIQRGSSGEFVRLNRAFHFEPFRELRTDWPLRFLDHLWDVAARYQAAMATVRVSRHLLTDQHTAILAAFESRDLAALDAAMAVHRMATLDVMATLPDADQVPDVDQPTGTVTARESPQGTAT